MKLRDSQSTMPDEMSIVNVFTRLIFDAEADLMAFEQRILESLGALDRSLVGSSRREISQYLQSMGVDEMISAVNHVRNHLVGQP